MKDPSLTVIVPAFNARRTIKEAIASIDAQDVRAAQIIIVDDASSDGTPDLLREQYGGREDVLLLSLEVNQGPAHARNAGLAKADGEWVAFLDGDDAWLPDRLAIQMSLASEHPDVDLWCGGVWRFGEAAPARTEGTQAEFRRIEQGEFLFHNPVATSTVLARRRVLNAVGGFDEQFIGPEDYDLWMRIGTARPMARVECPVSMYRYVPGSLSMDDRTFLPQVLRVLDKAFASGGAMAAFASERGAATGNQYWNASWMAFNRGDRITALRFLAKSYGLDHVSPRGSTRAWLPLLFRYLVGRRVSPDIDFSCEDRT